MTHEYPPYHQLMLSSYIYGYCRSAVYLNYLHEYNKFVKIKTSGNTLSLNVDFFLREHNDENKI
jgi:hypothetical protein